MLRVAIISTFLAFSGAAQAQNFGEPATGEILPGWRESDGQHMAGLSIQLAKGWKTYWRAPGEGGIPPQFNWSGSANVAAVDVRYPVPKVMEQNGLQSIGYDQDVVFALIVRPRRADQPVELRGEIELGVCEDICIPMILDVRGTLPATGAPDAAIAASLENQPKRAGAFSCEIEPIADGLRMRVITPMPNMRPEIAVVEPGETGVWTSPSVLKRSGNNLVAEVEMVPPSAAPFALARSDVRLTIIGGGRAVEMNGCR